MFSGLDYRRNTVELTIVKAGEFSNRRADLRRSDGRIMMDLSVVPCSGRLEHHGKGDDRSKRFASPGLGPRTYYPFVRMNGRMAYCSIVESSGPSSPLARSRHERLRHERDDRSRELGRFRGRGRFPVASTILPRARRRHGAEGLRAVGQSQTPTEDPQKFGMMGSSSDDSFAGQHLGILHRLQTSSLDNRALPRADEIGDF
ncbi:hypothetical protein F5144DRAFT_386336 [Chaetomium tenue]|uniref:Uncharacterized protein n=1 Tax=Chaetomium tenue TaxID=1854479 RepID=A0ACB7NV45_9PEZI|nr:hypothetical protein F5144DRAFT_386336 [Chaetomium globosum]